MARLGRFGKYRLIKRLGKGGMGEVYLAEDSALGRLVALKLLPHELVQNAESRSQFEREAKSLAALSHPGIVHLNAFDVVEGCPVLELEYIPGGSLRDRLSTEVLTAYTIVRYVSEIAAALVYTHANETLHRDLKPANILIDDHGHAKLADFGVAKILSSVHDDPHDLTRTGLFRGTPGYAPPEAWEGAEPSALWDVYGLGALLYECLTGVLPYDAGSALELARKIATTQHEPLRQMNSSLSTELCCLVDDMLQRDPMARISSAKEVLTRLRACPEFASSASPSDETVATVRPLPFHQPVERAQRRRRIAGGIAVLTLSMATLFIVGTFYEGGPRTLDSAVSEGGTALAIPGTLSVKPYQMVETSPHTAESVASRWLRIDHGEEFHTDTGEDWDTSILSQRPGFVAELRCDDKPEYGKVSVVGFWAAYADSGATILRHGPLVGTLSFTGDGQSCSGYLEYLDERTGRVHKSLLVGQSDTQETATEGFVETFVADRHNIALLYNEALPREWPIGEAFQNIVRAAANQRIDVPYEAPSDENPLVDGTLAESIWRRASAPLPAAYGSNSVATLRAILRGEQLLLAVSLPGQQAPATPVLELVVQGSYGVSPLQETHLKLLYADGIPRVTQVNGEGHEVVNDDAGLVAMQRAESHLTYEVAIDLTKTDVMQAEISAWRLACTVKHGPEPAAEILAGWGMDQDGVPSETVLMELQGSL